MTVPQSRDFERACAWWLRYMGYLSTTDERKVESLAAEFDLVRREAALDAMEAARALVRTSASNAQALDRLAKLMHQRAERAGMLTTQAADPNDDGLVCRCALDPRCPIHGDDA